MKRLVAIALLLALCVTMLPLSLAEESETEDSYQPLAYGAEGEAVTLIQHPRSAGQRQGAEGF